MNISIKCNCILLNQTLNIFLKNYINPNISNTNNIIISDKYLTKYNDIFLISDDNNANLSIPFSKTELIQSLKEFSPKQQTPEKTNTHNMDNEIKYLMQEYTKKIIHTIKKYQ
jgi:hypothetical protein